MVEQTEHAIKVVLFDLDDTLYPRTAGVMGQIRVLILKYMEERLGLATEEANALRREYLKTYGTTMRGLQAHHGIDPGEYLNFVHDMPLHEYIAPNPALDEALAAIPQKKVIFTNASRGHAERVLEVLDIRHHFDRIVDVSDMDYLSKPEPSSYRRICDMLGQRPEACVLVEDVARNLQPAKELGMVTVLVGEGQEGAEGVDYVISRIEEIGELMTRIDGRDQGP
ncbi:MAG: pyrimidine 5'-nucleotidase [Anaerolineae bacterium]|nr:pyrimidine 5'-nucleotidase [Anaerolineae bacterium]